MLPLPDLLESGGWFDRASESEAGKGGGRSTQSTGAPKAAVKTTSTPLEEGDKRRNGDDMDTVDMDWDRIFRLPGFLASIDDLHKAPMPRNGEERWTSTQSTGAPKAAVKTTSLLLEEENWH